MAELLAIFQVKLANLLLQRLVFRLDGQLFLKRKQLRRFPRIVDGSRKMLVNHDPANQQAEHTCNPRSEKKRAMERRSVHDGAGPPTAGIKPSRIRSLGHAVKHRAQARHAPRSGS